MISVKTSSGEKGFALVELLVAIVVIGILATVAIPRFIGAQDRAKVGAASADLDQVRQALGMYHTDYSDYPTSDYNSIPALEAILIDPHGGSYMTLPDGNNFASFSYEYDNSETPAIYVITVVARDNKNTTIIGTPYSLNQY